MHEYCVRVRLGGAQNTNAVSRLSAGYDDVTVYDGAGLNSVREFVFAAKIARVNFGVAVLYTAVRDQPEARQILNKTRLL